jgi:hypothetical protein
LIAAAGAWHGTPAITYSYSWQRLSSPTSTWTPVTGATAATLTLAASDIGATFRVQVTASNAAGSVTALSAATAAVAAVPVSNLTLPTVTGQAATGQTLTAHSGSYAGSAPIAVTGRQWLRCSVNGSDCAPITGATAATYTTNWADTGRVIKVSDAVTNPAGTTSTTSAGFGPLQVAEAPSCRQVNAITDRHATIAGHTVTIAFTIPGSIVPNAPMKVTVKDPADVLGRSSMKLDRTPLKLTASAAKVTWNRLQPRRTQWIHARLTPSKSGSKIVAVNVKFRVNAC